MKHVSTNPDSKPFLSILIPTWNRFDSVLNLLESIGSPPDDLEVVIVDNCSDQRIYDQLMQKVACLPYVRLFRNDTNIGMVKNWNKCISYANGEWMGLICSDDTFFDGAVMRAYEMLKTLTQPCLIIQDHTIPMQHEYYPPGTDTARSLSLPPASGNFWHRNVIEEIGSFDERLEYSPDAEFWSRIAYHFPIIKVREIFARYFSHENSYMWATWEKNDFFDQIELISRLNSKYTLGSNFNEENVNRAVEISLKQTLLTMLEATIFKDNKKHLFARYINKAHELFKTPEELQLLKEFKDHHNMFFKGSAPRSVPVDNRIKIPVTFSLTVYNEEKRIRFALEHAIRWADEVLIINKSSTDRTKEICLEYGNNIRVVDIPFSPRGHDDFVAYSKMATNNWIFFGTASEIPTRKLIEKIHEVLSETNGQLDLIHVPRKMYSFGIHSKLSPWSVSPYPFLVNRSKAIISNTIHENFKPSDPHNIRHIEFSDDCCVYHCTHSSAKAYINDMAQYFEAEAMNCTDPAAKIQECFNNIAMYEQRLRQGGDELLGHYCAWPVYWLGTALFIWEKQRNLDVTQYYDNLKNEVLEKEWLSPTVNDGNTIVSLAVSLPSIPVSAEEVTVTARDTFLVSAIVSTYKSEKFIRGCLEDLTRQSLFSMGLLEIVVINSASPQSEETVILEFKQKFPDQIKYLRTEKRETIYQAWNRGLRLASGKYITNANTDDRLRFDAMEIKAAKLENHPEIVLVYADQLYSDKPNDTFETTSSLKKREWVEFEGYQTIRSHCMVSSQPMWRRSLHDKYGYFDETYASAGDWEFWLRIGKQEKFLKINQVLGIYYKNPEGVENSHPLSNSEGQRVRQQYGISSHEQKFSGFAALDKNEKRYKPLVSVVIPCFNYAHYLRNAVESVVTQTFRNFEIIIVNDGSTDNSREVAEQLIIDYPEHRIKLINQKNSGHPACTRNRGISEASGKYILPLDADDMIAPTMLEKCAGILADNPSVSFSYSDRLDFDGIDQIVTAGEYNFNGLKYENHLSYCALFRREVWVETGGYRQVGCEDWDFWIAAGAKGFFGRRIPEPLFLYRRHDSGRFQMDIKNIDLIKAHIVLNNHSVYTAEEINSAEEFLMHQTTTRDNSPLVSVIVPTFNRPDMLLTAIRSILSQTFDNFEIIVVNDAGEDIEGLLRNLNCRGNISYVRHPHNRGLAASRNTGIRLACGKYIAYLDDDDIYYPDHLATLVSHLENSENKVAYTDAYRAHQQMENGRYIIIGRDLPYSHDFDYDAILINNFVPVLCFMHEKSCIDEVGPFDESLTTHEDWDLWIRISRNYKLSHIKKVTAEFTWRVDGSSMTSSGNEDFLRTTRIIYEKYREHTRNKLHIIKAQMKSLLARENAVHTSTQSAKEVKDTANLHDKAKNLATNGNLEDALICYKEILRTEPSDCSALIGIAILHLLSGKFSDATDALSKALHYDPTNSKALCGMGMVRNGQGFKNSGYEYFKKALDSDPDNQTALHEMIKLSYELDTFTEAEKRLTTYLMYHPGDLDMLFSLAGTLYKSARFDDARDSLESLLALSPEYAGGSELLAMILTKIHETSINEVDKDAITCNSQTAENLAKLGRTKKEAGNYEEAMEVFRKAGELGDKSVLHEMGDCKANLGKLDEALDCYVECLENAPEDTRALVGLGVINLLQGNHTKAVTWFNKTLKCDPLNIKALCGLGMVRNLQNKPKEALKYFSLVLDSDPENLNALHEVVKCSYELNKFGEAEKYLQSYLMYHPGDLDMLFSMAGVFFKKEEYSAALEYVENLLIFEPGYAGGIELREKVYTQLKKAV